MKNMFKLGLLALAFGFMVLGAAEPAYSVVSPIEQDGESAIIYFIGYRNFGDLWDGDTPIGSFDQVNKKDKRPIIVWKTAPGVHVLQLNATNWAVIKTELEPNMQYFVQARLLPSPPFTRLVTIQGVTPDSGVAMLKHKNAKILSFSDTWRAEQAQGKKLESAQANYQAEMSK